MEECHDHDVMVPIQELVHKKKCLLPDVGAAIGATEADTFREYKADLVIKGNSDVDINIFLIKSLR